MHEESIYNLYYSSIKTLDTNQTNNNQIQSLKDMKINLLKPPNFEPPLRGKTAAEFYHLNSKKILTSKFTIPSKEHGTFGLPKSAYTLTKNDENKIIPTLHLMRMTSCSRVNEIEQCCHIHLRPPVPKLKDAPIQGLSSNVNFINNNRERAMSMRPKPVKTSVNFLKKGNYGTPPCYLEKVKDTITKEKEFIQMISEARNSTQSTRIELSKEEIEKLKDGLLRKYDEVNKRYQSITHVSKVYSLGIKRKKEGCEKELLQIEKDFKMLEKERIVID